MEYVEIAIPVPLKRTFTYSVPDGVEARVGSLAVLPFGHRTMTGIVMGASSSRGNVKIKNIIEVLHSAPVFSQKMVDLLKWIADYYCAPIGEVCKAALPLEFSRRTKKKREVMPKDTIIDDVFLSAPEFKLKDSQAKAYETLKSEVRSQKFGTTLLHGITGSGKTEVYLRLFEDVLKTGKEAIFLVPEIGLTPQVLGRLTARFGDLIAISHSGLTPAKRAYEWKRMQDGSAKIVIGTRSAIFAPFKNLGIIVVDEEHDSSYKQDESPRYNGRDVAVMRAKMENIPCVLGSATPSIESFANAKNGKYHYLHLPDRPTGALLPDVDVVDMREVNAGSVLSPQLIGAIGEALTRKEQTMLFLNKRGFASFILCQECGHTYTCPNCNITLTYHKHENTLLCHYCDYKTPPPQKCEKCGSSRVIPLGTGTEKIETELKNYFPKAKVERLDRDTTTKVGVRPKILSNMKQGSTDILIGTQMITKGHDFPNVTLVGVIDADMSLNFPDFRAPERTFQLVTQVAGRSGRANRKGTVIVQTFMPEHYAIAAAQTHDFFRFFDEEMPARRELGYPPFGRLALIRIQGLKEKMVETSAKDLFRKLSTINYKPLTVLGPAPAPLAKVRGKFRWHILIRSGDIKAVRQMIDRVAECESGLPKGIKVIVDVDPINML